MLSIIIGTYKLKRMSKHLVKIKTISPVLNESGLIYIYNIFPHFKIFRDLLQKYEKNQEFLLTFC
jgi:hypothetical protein